MPQNFCRWPKKSCARLKNSEVKTPRRNYNRQQVRFVRWTSHSKSSTRKSQQVKCRRAAVQQINGQGCTHHTMMASGRQTRRALVRAGSVLSNSKCSSRQTWLHFPAPGEQTVGIALGGHEHNGNSTRLKEAHLTIRRMTPASRGPAQESVGLYTCCGLMEMCSCATTPG